VLVTLDAVQDMDQLMTAIELYRNQHGHIPGDGSGCNTDGGKLRDESWCVVTELQTVMTSIPIDPLAENDADYYYVYDNWHGNTSGKCDNEPSVTISFNSSETGINDQHTTSGCDQNVCNADFNRIICLD